MSDSDCAEVQLFDLMSKALASQDYHMFVTMARSNVPTASASGRTAFRNANIEDIEFEYIVIAMIKPEGICESLGNHVPFECHHSYETTPVYYAFTGEQNLLTKYCIDHGLPTVLPEEYPNEVPCYSYSDDLLTLGMHDIPHLMLAYEDFEKYAGFPHDEFCKIIISRIIERGFRFKKSRHLPLVIDIEGGKYMNAEELLIDMQISNKTLDSL